MLELIFVHDNALVHEQEHNFIRGREKSDRRREVGRKGGGKWGLGIPLSTPSTTEPPQTSLEAAELKLIGVSLHQVWWQLR